MAWLSSGRTNVEVCCNSPFDHQNVLPLECWMLNYLLYGQLIENMKSSGLIHSPRVAAVGLFHPKLCYVEGLTFSFSLSFVGYVEGG